MMVSKTIFYIFCLSILGFLAIPECFSQSTEEQLNKRSPGEMLFDKGMDMMKKKSGWEIDSSLYYWEKAAPLLEEEKKWEAWVNCLNGLYFICYQLEDFEKLKKYAYQAIYAAKTHLEPSHSHYQDASNNLGSYHSRQGNYEQALALTYQALNAIENSPSPNKEQLGHYYNNIGYNLRRKGDFKEGLKFYKKAEKLHKEVLDKKDKTIADIYNNQAKLLNEIGQSEKAIPLYKKAIKIYLLKTDGKSIENNIDIHQSLARIYVNQNRKDSALFYLREAEFYLKKVSASKARYIEGKIGVNYRITADLHVQNKAYNKALEFRKKEAEEFLKILKGRKKHPRVAESYQRLGDAHALLEQYEESLSAYQTAIDFISKDTENKDVHIHPSLEDILYPIDAIPIIRGKAKVLGQYYAKNGDLKVGKSAVEAYQLAAQLITKARRDIRSAESKLMLAAQSIPTYEEALSMVKQLHQTTGDAKYLATFFELLEQNKAALLYESLQEAQAKNTVGIPDSILTKEKENRLELAFYKKQLFDAENNGREIDSTQLKQWKDIIFALERDQVELEAVLEKSYPTYYQLKYDEQTINLKQVQQELPNAQTALVEYFWGDSSVFALLITKDKVVAHQIQKDTNLQATLTQLIRDISDREFVIREGESQSTIQQFAHQSSSLYQELLAPVMTDDIEEIIVIPDGLLSYLPFDILLTDSNYSTTEAAYYELPYLLRKSSIRYAYSTALLLNPPQPHSSNGKQELYAGFAPTYGDNGKVATSRGGETALSGVREGYGALTSNKKEVEEIARLMGGKSFLATDATENAFKESTNMYKVLHLAMHAFIHDSLPEFSSMIFSQNSDSEKTDNEGILYAYEIYNLNIPAELAVLSACHTGSGKMARGEGVMSLARAFMYAGCSNIAMSLWQADDETTRIIMERFFYHMKEGLGKGKALQAAKLDYFEKKELLHPYYWAGFVLIGDDEPIEKSAIPSVLFILIGVVMLGAAGFFLKKRLS